MDTKQLENLIALVEEGNVREAALHQHISQPGLSMSIKRLEEVLKITLFQREGRKIRPTDRCLEFYQHAKLALAQLNLGRADLPSAENISLRFGIGETRSDHFIGNLTVKLEERFPGIRLEIIEQRYTKLLPRLANGDIDAAFIGVPRNAIPDLLDATLLHTTHMCVACRPGHPLADRKRALTDRDMLKATWATSRKWPTLLASRDGQLIIRTELAEGSLIKLSARRFSYKITIFAVRRPNLPSRVLDAAFEIARASFARR